MFTSLLYQALGIRGYRNRRTAYRKDQVLFAIDQDPSTLRCGDCGSDRVTRQGRSQRKFHAPPIGGKSVALVLPIQRVYGQHCHKVRQVKVRFADARRR